MIYFVATPIGNLSDISLRALEVLKSVDTIACEDTRNSSKLLNHYGIAKPLISHHKHNEKSSTEGIIELLKQGKTLAVISDSGMPLISDPGSVLVARLQSEQLPFSVVPGANAALSALVLSGFSAQAFSFLGFLPEKQIAKETLLQPYLMLPSTLIFYLTPHNLQKDLQFLFSVLGKRNACLVKEITKMFETVVHFTLGQQVAIDERGEFVLVVEGATAVASSTAQIEEELKYLFDANISQSESVKMVAKKLNANKNEVYAVAIELSKQLLKK